MKLHYSDIIFPDCVDVKACQLRAFKLLGYAFEDSLVRINRILENIELGKLREAERNITDVVKTLELNHYNALASFFYPNADSCNSPAFSRINLPSYSEHSAENKAKSFCNFDHTCSHPFPPSEKQYTSIKAFLLETQNVLVELLMHCEYLIRSGKYLEQGYLCLLQAEKEIAIYINSVLEVF